MSVHQFIHFNTKPITLLIIYENPDFNVFTIKILKVAVFDLKIAIRLVAVPLAATTATHLKIQLSSMI